MADRPAVTNPNLWIAVVILAAIGVAVAAILGINRSGDEGSGLSDAFEYQIEPYKNIDPALIAYDETGQFDGEFARARAVAVGPEDRIYVAGDQAIRLFEPNGTLTQEIPLEAAPRCLAVAGSAHAEPGRIYVGMEDHVEVLDPTGSPLATWESLDRPALITAVAVAEQDVFVADAGNGKVLHYNLAGESQGEIGARGFAIPSPFFDLAVGPERTLHVVHPGALRIETWSFDGDLELFWGEAASDVEGFFGCCNPAHFALTSDGRFVTAEKGLVRVKVYTADGRFESVIAGPRQFDAPGRGTDEGLWDKEHKAVDVAVDSADRVLVLDLATGMIRTFEQKKTSEPEAGVE